MIPVEDVKMELWHVHMVHRLAKVHGVTSNEELRRILNEYFATHAESMHRVIEETDLEEDDE